MKLIARHSIKFGKIKNMKIKKLKVVKPKKKNKILYLGGKDVERLYLRNVRFKMADGRDAFVTKTDIPGADMGDVIARHKGRYALLALFSRPGYNLLDFPCGSGYAADFLKEFGVKYNGKEVNRATIEYANRIYGGKDTLFDVGDLRSPKLGLNLYDVIGCIEGLEHIDKKYQSPLISSFYKALKPSGTLIVSTPETESGVSGRSVLSPYHKWELNKNDFLALLYKHFGSQNVELVTFRATMSTGILTTCFFGICHKKHENKK